MLRIQALHIKNDLMLNSRRLLAGRRSVLEVREALEVQVARHLALVHPAMNYRHKTINKEGKDILTYSIMMFHVYFFLHM